MAIRINVDRSYESANWIKSVRDSNKADKYKKKNKKLKKSNDLPELLTLLTAAEYLVKQEESEWSRFEDWTWKLPETQKYRHDGGKHVGPHGGKYDVIGYEITVAGDPIGPGMVTGAGVPRSTRVPVQPAEELDFRILRVFRWCL